MILILGIAAGWLAGSIRTLITGKPYHIPDLSQIWLVFAAVIPQLLIFQNHSTSGWFSDQAAAVILVITQLALLVFIWFNRDKTGILILGLGLFLNLLVITLNGGLMPLSPHTAAVLYPDLPFSTWEIGTRPGWSKNILLWPENTHLAWLSDSILLPDWSPWAKALSPGDLLIVLGAFWLLAVESIQQPLPPEKVEISLVL